MGEKQIFEILNSHCGLKGKMKGDETAVTAAHVIWLSLVFQQRTCSHCDIISVKKKKKNLSSSESLHLRWSKDHPRTYCISVLGGKPNCHLCFVA